MPLLPLGRCSGHVNPYSTEIPARGYELLRTPCGLAGCFDTVLPTIFRFVEGGIGRRDEFLAGAVLGEGRDPEAGRDPHRDALLREDRPPLEGFAGTFGELGTAAGVGRGQDQGELFAAPTRRDVHSPERLAQDTGELAQDVVADEMTEAVVHGLEGIEVAEHEREWPAEASGALEFRLERRLRVAAVREAGETVDQRLLLDDPVQTRVVECDHGVRRKRDGGDAVLVVELRADQHDPSEARPTRA